MSRKALDSSLHDVPLRMTMQGNEFIKKEKGLKRALS